MNKRIRLKGFNCQFIKLPNEINSQSDIKRIWNLYSEKQVIENAPFNPFTGEKVKRAEDAVLTHNKGVFLEDYVHDWNIKDDNLFIYSRVVGKNEEIELIIELT